MLRCNRRSAKLARLYFTRDSPMIIERHRVVTFHYTLFNASNEVLESSKDSTPSAYLHGANNILPALEKELAGKAAGDTVSATLSAKEAYGERDPKRQQRVPVKHLRFKGKLQPGQVVQVNTDRGPQPATVIKAGKFSADLDTNHPLAGQELTFDIEILDVRAALPEEISHGHVHGPGGHQH